MAILKKAQLLDHIVLERGVPANRRSLGPGEDDFWDLKVKALTDPKANLYIFNTTAEAQRYEEELKEALGHVKGAIDAHRDVKVESKSFEL